MIGESFAQAGPAMTDEALREFRYDFTMANGCEVFSRQLADGREVHVTPRGGSFHALSAYCWCVPRRDGSNPRVLIHREGIRS